MNIDSRSELERWFDSLPADYDLCVPIDTSKKFAQLIRILKNERDSWKSTAFACEKERKKLLELTTYWAK